MNLCFQIGNLNLKVITITKLIDIFDNNNQIFHYLYLHKGLVPCQIDNINRDYNKQWPLYLYSFGGLAA